MRGVRRRPALPLLVLLPASLILATCVSGSGGDGTGAGGGATRAELTVMEFNIEYGGDGIEFGKVIEAIEMTGADVVAIEEAEGNTGLIAEELGWPYFDARRQLVSKLPLLPSSEDTVAFVEVQPGRVAAIGNVHLTSSPYGPNVIKNKGWDEEEVLELEQQVRLPEIEPSLEALTELAGQGYPVFLVGDFNTPSHRDWTEETVGARPQMEFPLQWPVTKTVEDAGFVDSYREMHPDPTRDPGLTWPAARPEIKGEWNPPPDAAEDRIDYIYAAGPVETVQSVLVGEEGGPGVELSVTPWPTDHRGIVSSFRVAPAPPPVLVGVDRKLYTAGDEVQATYHGTGEAGQAVAIVPEGESPGSALVEQSAEGTDGRVALPTSDLEAGAYEAVLVSGSGEELSRTQLWIQEAGAGPEVGTTRPTYRVGQPIEVEWRNAPANRWDWLGLYRRGANPNIAYYINWEYTGASVEGTYVFDDDSHGPWPLDPGKYSVYLLIDDGYEKVAEGNFTVRE